MAPTLTSRLDGVKVVEFRTVRGCQMLTRRTLTLHGRAFTVPGSRRAVICVERCENAPPTEDFSRIEHAILSSPEKRRVKIRMLRTLYGMSGRALEERDLPDVLCLDGEMLKLAQSVRLALICAKR